MQQRSSVLQRRQTDRTTLQLLHVTQRPRLNHMNAVDICDNPYGVAAFEEVCRNRIQTPRVPHGHRTITGPDPKNTTNSRERPANCLNQLRTSRYHPGVAVPKPLTRIVEQNSL